MEYKIANIFTIVFFAVLLALWLFVSIKKAVSIKAKEKETVKETKARAKILFKSVNEYDKTNLTNLTTYHVRELYIDCLIDGEKKTFLCGDYMFDYVQKGETYDVVYTSNRIALDKKYYPEDFDDYFDDLDDPDNEEESQ